MSDAHEQLKILDHGTNHDDAFRLMPFHQKPEGIGLYPLKPTALEIFQLNAGEMCNQVCGHCHVGAGPDRREIMTRETMQQCLDMLKINPSFKTVVLTGGTPEMNPDFRWFIEEIKKANPSVNIVVRCNLTIIRSNKKYHDLPDFFKQHNIEVVSSLPFYTKDRLDRQWGDGAIDDAIRGLQMLNAVVYGVADHNLTLNLVYNPPGAFLPPSQSFLEMDFKESLQKAFGIVFNNLFAITNLPISRYLDYLLQSGNYEKYIEKLITAFNPTAAANVMWRNTISIGWDGFLYDGDFNQMLELKVDCGSKRIAQFNVQQMAKCSIVINLHCHGCTAGAGSSGGAVTA